ncbi:MAG: hypothetical protein VX265_13810 [Myxococcota bacterium]|nr:hypothetical protein [Myxococcota bacterium]
MRRASRTSNLALAVSGVGTTTLLAAGALGGLVMQTVGGPLAMGLAIWTGRTTEPQDPGGGFWWSSFVSLAVLALVPLWLARRQRARAARWGPAVSTLAALAAGTLPFIWLWSASRGT